jgi:ABC-type transport system involved in multi-copper enzyme maturation permease subunit
MVSALRDNPVLVKEFRVRMRGARAYWIITGYLLFLSFILFMQYTMWWNRTQAEGHSLASGSKIGQEFLLWLTVTQAFLVAFITPAITSGAITIEREQRTLEMLEMTRLSPAQVVIGKLSSAVGFVILLLVSSVPLASICFFLGGVSPQQIGYTYLMLAAGAFLAGTLGLVWSSVARTTAAAVVLTYGSLLAPFVFMFFVAIFMGPWGPGWEAQLLVYNLLGVFGIPSPGAEDYSPIADYFRYWDHSRYFGLTLPPWLPGMLSFGLIGLALATTAAVRLAARPEKRGSLLRWMVVALFLEQMFFFFGARFCAYTASAPSRLATVLSGYPLMLHLLYPVLMLLVVAPVFSTGDLRPGEARRFTSYLFKGWSRLGWGTTRLSSGWPTMCVLTALVVGTFALSFVVVGHGREAMSGRIAAASQPVTAPPPAAGSPFLVMPPGSQPTPTQARPVSGGVPQLAIMLLATVTGIFFAGMFLSMATGNRWVAMMLLYVALGIVLIAPFMALASYRNAIPGTSPGILINLFYLNPLFAIVEMSNNSGNFWSNLPLMFGKTPAWQVATVLYAVIALISAMLSGPFVTRTAARSVLPYEELGARA